MGRLGFTLDDWLSGKNPPPIARFLKIDMRSCAGGESVLAMRVEAAHHNPMGTVHGGILCDLADAAMGTAVASLLGRAESFTTAELGARFLEPMIDGLVTARARVIRKGRSAAFVECEVSDEGGRVVGKFDSTCLIRHARPASA
jgi:uncharacterized protein (TIGR00369 family)